MMDNEKEKVVNNNPNRDERRKEKNMNTWTRRVPLAMLIVSNLALGAPAAESPTVFPPSDIDQMVGQPADLSAWAYAWRADLKVQAKPEAYFIPRRLERLDKIYRNDTKINAGRGTELRLKTMPPAPKGILHSALMWETRVPWTRIELHWPKDGRPIPPSEVVEVRIYAAHQWWWGLQADWSLAKPELSADKMSWSYRAAVAPDSLQDGRDSLAWPGKQKYD